MSAYNNHEAEEHDAMQMLEDISIMALDMLNGADYITLLTTRGDPIQENVAGLIGMYGGMARIIKDKADYAIMRLYEERRGANGAA